MRPAIHHHNGRNFRLFIRARQRVRIGRGKHRRLYFGINVPETRIVRRFWTPFLNVKRASFSSATDI